jgi:hypothetical protein
MALPVTISLLPGRNMRPCTSRTCGRSARPSSEVPRTVTLLGLPLPRLGRLFSTTGSRDTIRRPCPSVAMPGRLSMMAACAREMAELISAPAPLRSTITLSGWPVATSVARMPSLIISTVANTYTTSAMPPAVSKVVTRRTHRLRAM